GQCGLSKPCSAVTKWSVRSVARSREGRRADLCARSGGFNRRYARLPVCAATMTFDFFEGAAGTGKTYNLVGRAGVLVQEGALGEGHKLLALTFMNGARRRLDARLGENPLFRRRFDCQTFDVFARTLAARRRSLITQAMQEQAAALNE